MGEISFRWRLYYWIIRLIKYPDGQELNKVLIVLRFILMPIDTLRHLPLLNRYNGYNPISDIYTIEGIKYSGEIFRAWGRRGLPTGTIYQIIKRDPSGAITIKDLTADYIKTRLRIESLIDKYIRGEIEK